MDKKKLASSKEKMLDARIQKSDVSGIYKKAASVCDHWGRLTDSKARERCLELAKIRDGESVLEVAVDTGLAFAEILRLNPTGQNEGVDLTEDMLSRAKQKAQRLGLGRRIMLLEPAMPTILNMLTPAST